MKIHIKNLRLRCIVGVFAWEREEAQDIIINIEIEFDGSQATETDNIKNTVDYKSIKKRIIREVESSQFSLLETLASHILDIVMTDQKIKRARVEVDKPHALRFADSISVECFAER